MMHFTVGSTTIKTTIPKVKQFANDTYYKYHKSNRLKQMLLEDERVPVIKITGDIFSMQIWFITDEGIEQRIFLDGNVFLNSVTIHTITLEGEHFSEAAVKEFKCIFSELSKIGEGYIYFELDGYLNRLVSGNLSKYNALIDELFKAIPQEKQEEFETLIDNLKV